MISKSKKHSYNILNNISKNIIQQQNNNSVKLEDNPNAFMNDDGKNEEMEIDSDVKQSSQNSLDINNKKNGKKIYHIGNISFSNTENSYGDNFSTSNNSNIENEKKSINNSIKTIEYSEDAKKSEADKTIEMSEENEEDLNNKLILTCEYEYIDEILENLKLEEESNIYKINPNYFKYQVQINYNMRLILIDWLFEVYKKLRFKEETFFTTIYIIDAYLSKKFVTKKNLQLLGVTALLIATKLNEISAGRVKDYVFITDKAYDEDDIIYMESNISRTFKFNFLVPTCLSFFEIISKKLQFDKDSNKINLGIFIAFGGGSVILFIFSLLAFLDVKGLHIEEGKNIRGGIILLINTVLYGSLAYIINLRIQRLKFEEEKNKNQDNFLELPSFFSKIN